MDILITRKEFNQNAVVLLKQTVEKVKELLERYGKKLDFIILTGGASQMPIVLEYLEQELKEYQGKIIFHRPSRAISYGTARYGAIKMLSQTSEPTPDPDPVVTRHLSYDIGIRYKDETTNQYFISRSLKAGTEIPCTSPWERGYKLSESQYVRDCVYEATRQNPGENNVDTDWRYIVETRVDFGRVVPKGTESECRLVIDQRGLLTIEAREREGGKIFPATYTLHNLS